MGFPLFQAAFPRPHSSWKVESPPPSCSSTGCSNCPEAFAYSCILLVYSPEENIILQHQQGISRRGHYLEPVNSHLAPMSRTPERLSQLLLQCLSSQGNQ